MNVWLLLGFIGVCCLVLVVLLVLARNLHVRWLLKELRDVGPRTRGGLAVAVSDVLFKAAQVQRKAAGRIDTRSRRRRFGPRIVNGRRSRMSVVSVKGNWHE